MRAAQVALVEELRRREDLLSPAAVKAIRAKFSLTQAELENVLGVAPKTVVRWERGTVCQSRAIDQLLRIADAVPGAFEFLARRAGIAIAESAAPRVEGTCSILPFPTPLATKTFPLDERPVMPKISAEALK